MAIFAANIELDRRVVCDVVMGVAALSLGRNMQGCRREFYQDACDDAETRVALKSRRSCGLTFLNTKKPRRAKKKQEEPSQWR